VLWKIGVGDSFNEVAFFKIKISSFNSELPSTLSTDAGLQVCLILDYSNSTVPGGFVVTS